MNTHDKIELPEPKFRATSKFGTYTRFITNDPSVKKGDGAYTEEQVLQILEADRQRRGEPVGILKRVAMGEPVFYSHDDKAYELPLGEHPLYAAPQPAEPVENDNALTMADYEELLRKLVDQYKKFASSGYPNQEEAYYKLYKYALPYWKEACKLFEGENNG